MSETSQHELNEQVAEFQERLERERTGSVGELTSRTAGTSPESATRPSAGSSAREYLVTLKPKDLTDLWELARRMVAEVERATDAVRALQGPLQALSTAVAEVTATAGQEEVREDDRTTEGDSGTSTRRCRCPNGQHKHGGER